MKLDFTKPALLIGHPGHELRAFKFIQEYKPDVFVLTDGSGSKNMSRVHGTIKILKNLGANFREVFIPYTDKEIYQHILKCDIEEFIKIRNIVSEDVLSEGYDLLIGDALEGFNPTHDLCRYIINSVVKKINNGHHGFGIKNISFKLDGPSEKENFGEVNSNGLQLFLSDSDFNQKYESALDYPELKYEVDKAISFFGKETFKIEYYEIIHDLETISNWGTSIPYYEKYGNQKFSEGIYNEVIEFQKHMKPIALALLEI